MSKQRKSRSASTAGQGRASSPPPPSNVTLVSLPPADGTGRGGGGQGRASGSRVPPGHGGEPGRAWAPSPRHVPGQRVHRWPSPFSFFRQAGTKARGRSMAEGKVLTSHMGTLRQLSPSSPSRPLSLLLSPPHLRPPPPACKCGGTCSLSGRLG